MYNSFIYLAAMNSGYIHGYFFIEHLGFYINEISINKSEMWRIPLFEKLLLSKTCGGKSGRLLMI